MMGELAKSYMAYANFQKASEFAEKALKGKSLGDCLFYLITFSWILHYLCFVLIRGLLDCGCQEHRIRNQVTKG